MSYVLVEATGRRLKDDERDSLKRILQSATSVGRVAMGLREEPFKAICVGFDAKADASGCYSINVDDLKLKIRRG